MLILGLQQYSLFSRRVYAEPVELPACRMIGQESTTIGGRIIVVGDIHGSNAGLREILAASGVIDSVESCTWSMSAKNRQTTLVQMGDLVDRGAEALEAWDCLDELYASIPSDVKSNGSSLVRIIGNHEVWWLENKFHMRHTKADTQERVLDIVRRMKNQINLGALVGAHVVEVNSVPLLFVHAGYRRSYLDSSEIKNAHGLAGKFNSVLGDVIRSCSNRDWKKCPFDLYEGELFQAGPERGGSHLGGPLWTDFKVLEEDDIKNGRSSSPFPFIQIVGHSAAYCDDGDDSNGFPDMGHCPELIRATVDVEAVCVDGGMTYGTRSFLEIVKDSGALLAHEKEGLSDAWKVRKLNSELVCSR